MTRTARICPLLVALLLTWGAPGSAETPETILIRVTLGNELSGHRRADAELTLSAYHPDLVVYTGNGNADPRAWTLQAEERTAFAQALKQDLAAHRYETERTLPLIGVRGTQAIVTSLDSGVVVDRANGLPRRGDVRRCWLLRKVENDWLITALVDDLGDSLLPTPSSPVPDPEVVELLSREEQGWEAGNAGAVADLYAETLTGFDGLQTARPETWKFVISGAEEWRRWLGKRLANATYTLDRQVIHTLVGPGRRQALAVTRERVATRHRLGDKVHAGERNVLWLLTRQGRGWRIFGFCYNLRLPQ